MNDESDISFEDTLGIGVDIVEIQRIRNLDTSSPFYKRVYTEQEMDYCFSYKDPSPHLAAIFSGKEAVIKAVGKKALLSMQSIEISHDDTGLPKVTICQLPDIKILISLAHSREHAIAIALLLPSSKTVSETVLRSLLTERTFELLKGSE